ncbi:hypothetical protein [Streptomyces sp. NRRL WC-3725]|uniref:hypothetical protein n=1 Tax=Streptomyces sp. NRRL WC-3725 TaxID=1463933 RepID=UPI0004C8DC99|nr:hypothetical protein [Streptomyces sp. NRRL WC-3725]
MTAMTAMTADMLDRTGTVTVRVLDRSGQPMDCSGLVRVPRNDATGAVCFPVGTYRLLGAGPPGVSPTCFARDGLRVDGERTVTLDSRQAEPVTAELNGPAARPETYSANVTLRSVAAGTARANDSSGTGRWNACRRRRSAHV